VGGILVGVQCELDFVAVEHDASALQPLGTHCLADLLEKVQVPLDVRGGVAVVYFEAVCLELVVDVLAFNVVLNHLVGQLAGVDHRAPLEHCGVVVDVALEVRVEEHTETEAFDSRQQRDEVVRKFAGQHGDVPFHQLDRSQALLGLLVDGTVGLDEVGHVSDVHPHLPLAHSRVPRDAQSVVQVFRAQRVDGEYSQLSEVFPRDLFPELTKPQLLLQVAHGGLDVRRHSVSGVFEVGPLEAHHGLRLELPTLAQELDHPPLGVALSVVLVFDLTAHLKRVDLLIPLLLVEHELLLLCAETVDVHLEPQETCVNGDSEQELVCLAQLV